MAVILIGLNIYVYCYAMSKCFASTLSAAHWLSRQGDKLQAKGCLSLASISRGAGSVLGLIVIALWMMPLVLTMWFLVAGCVTTASQRVMPPEAPASARDIRELLSPSIESQEERILGHKKTAPKE